VRRTEVLLRLAGANAVFPPSTLPLFFTLHGEDSMTATRDRRWGILIKFDFDQAILHFVAASQQT
jgi:hypothetical protein